MTNSTAMLRAMSRQISDLGVRAEIEAFDTGHLWQAKSLVDEGLIAGPVMVQLCMGVPWGAPPDINTFMAMVNNVPDDWTWSAFSLGRRQMEYVALAAIAVAVRASGHGDRAFAATARPGESGPDATAGASTAVASGSGSVVRRTSTSTKIEM